MREIFHKSSPCESNSGQLSRPKLMSLSQQNAVHENVVQDSAKPQNLCGLFHKEKKKMGGIDKMELGRYIPNYVVPS